MKSRHKLYTLYLLCIIQIAIPLYAQEEKLQEIVVQSDIDANRIMRAASINFAKKYATSYASEILHYRAVYTQNRCIEFNSYQGIFLMAGHNWNSKDFYWKNSANWSRTAPLTVFRSNAYLYSNDLLATHSIFPESKSYNSNYYKIHYNNKLANHGYLLYRTIELFSPINKKMVKYFNFKVLKQYTDISNYQYMLIEFSTKEGEFPHNTKLKGTGTILYNITARYPQEITISNYMDFYSSFVRTSDKYFKGLASEHNIKIRYFLQNNILYLDEIILNASWPHSSGEQSGRLYSLIDNPRRNPFKQNLSLTEVFKFNNHKTLSKRQVEILAKNFHTNSTNFTEYYCAPYIPEKWENVKFDYVNFPKIQQDLGFATPLVQQAYANALTAYEERVSLESANYIHKLNFSKEYYIITQKTIFPLIYNTKY